MRRTKPPRNWPNVFGVTLPIKRPYMDRHEAQSGRNDLLTVRENKISTEILYKDYP